MDDDYLTQQDPLSSSAFTHVDPDDKASQKKVVSNSLHEDAIWLRAIRQAQDSHERQFRGAQGKDGKSFARRWDGEGKGTGSLRRPDSKDGLQREDKGEIKTVGKGTDDWEPEFVPMGGLPDDEPFKLVTSEEDDYKPRSRNKYLGRRSRYRDDLSASIDSLLRVTRLERPWIQRDEDDSRMLSLQKDDILKFFLELLLNRLSTQTHRLDYDTDDGATEQRLLSHLATSVEEYTRSFESRILLVGIDSHIREAAGILCRYRSDLVSLLHASLFPNVRGSIHSEASNSLKSVSSDDKIRQVQKPATMLSEHDSKVSSHEDHAPRGQYHALEAKVHETASPGHPSEDSSGVPVSMSKLCRGLTEPPAFRELIDKMLWHYQRLQSNQMRWIRHCIEDATNEIPQRGGENYLTDITLRIDWDPVGFLTESYEKGIQQDLRSIIAITGSVKDAQLLSVEEYIKKTWPQTPSRLVQAMESALRGPPRTEDPPTGLTFSPDLKVARLRGTRNYVVLMAQQISWITAVLSHKKASMQYAFLSFTQSSAITHIDVEQGMPCPNMLAIGHCMYEDSFCTFRHYPRGMKSRTELCISISHEPPSEEEGRSCWNTVVGPAILTRGFPQPLRKAKMKGLELSVANMAAITGTRQAVVVDGGVVLKARCHALVPIEDCGEAVQWHLVDTYPEKLDWLDIDELCPKRLRGEDLTAAIWTRRAYLGWWPGFTSFLGNELYDYAAVTYSDASQPKRWAQINKFTVGFSQWGTATAEITLGKRDGYMAQRPDDYESMLDDARDIPVILHDTQANRAFQTDGEALILHILSHRQAFCRPKQLHGDSQVVQCQATSSYRQPLAQQYLLGNANTSIFIRRRSADGPDQKVVLRDEAELIYSTLDGLWAQGIAQARLGKRLGLSIEHRHSLAGWEYMDVVKHSRYMEPKTVDLESTCGRWSQYARDINAIVLFGANFGQLYKPLWPRHTRQCRHFQSLPEDNSYMAIPMCILMGQFEKLGCLRTQRRLTSTGLSLHGSSSLSEQCPGGCTTHRSCSEQRLVRFTTRASSTRTLLPLQEGGMVIIGEPGLSLLERVLQKPGKSKAHSSQGRSERQAVYRARPLAVQDPQFDQGEMPIGLCELPTLLPTITPPLTSRANSEGFLHRPLTRQPNFTVRSPAESELKRISSSLSASPRSKHSSDAGSSGRFSGNETAATSVVTDNGSNGFVAAGRRDERDRWKEKGKERVTTTFHPEDLR